ncbi:hypothetical protein XBFM1_1540005 [Xenorhabdus bovienii str. feltiae Moldova]|uniref:Uncharacterized protein n=1 Tax=Xenorhabdus bovienii str. feltiae Moldova TaxID=1398200 RepID=A0A077NRT8_XENBV|nr:hypothetical protein XBFM1_1540005 [Xenorhabdus bovienii str. feltiae Moldova]
MDSLLSRVAVVGSSQCLAINRNNFTFGTFVHRLNPVNKTWLKLGGIEAGDNTRYRVMNSQPCLKQSLLLKPIEAHFPEIFNIFPPFSPSDNSVRVRKSTSNNGIADFGRLARIL